MPTLFLSFFIVGPRPLEKDGFHSFIEDWNRSTGAAGHTVFREAEYFNTDAQIDMVSTGESMEGILEDAEWLIMKYESTDWYGFHWN